jgi:prevent-host-death family protein
MIIPAGQFKARCLKLMDAVNRTGEEIVITKRGKPVAKLVRAGKPKRPKAIFGCMAGTAKILGDIIAPIGEVWDAER